MSYGLFDKLGRNYNLGIQTNIGSTIQISLPFTIEFDITRTNQNSQNVCKIRIYNLSEQTRNLIRHDENNYGLPYQSIVLNAGYGTGTNANLPTIFSGQISHAWSAREGVNFVTNIECWDNAFAAVNGKTNVSFPAGTPMQSIISSLAASLPNVQLGAIGSFPGILSRGNSYAGNTVQILTQITGGAFFIDNGFANALGNNEYIFNFGTIPLVIDSSVGLLNTPLLENTIVRFDMIFEPQLQVGQQIMLNSITESGFNGSYKLITVKHRGMISPTVCGEVITSASFYYLQQPMTPVSPGGFLAL